MLEALSSVTVLSGRWGVLQSWVMDKEKREEEK